MGGVVVDLRALVGPERVLDRELVEAELAGELVQLLLRRTAEVDPHDRVGLLEILRDVGDGEVLRLEDPLAVHPGVRRAHGARRPFVHTPIRLPIGPVRTDYATPEAQGWDAGTPSWIRCRRDGFAVRCDHAGARDRRDRFRGEPLDGGAGRERPRRAAPGAGQGPGPGCARPVGSRGSRRRHGRQCSDARRTVRSAAYVDGRSPSAPPDAPVGAIATPYSRSKAESDLVARRWQDRDAPVTITYPGIVMGPHDPHFGESQRFIVSILRGRIPFKLDGVFPIADVRYVGAAHAAVMQAGHGADRYLLTGHDTSGDDHSRRCVDSRLSADRASSLQPMTLLAGKVADAVERVVPGACLSDPSLSYILASMPRRTDSSKTREESASFPRRWSRRCPTRSPRWSLTVVPLHGPRAPSRAVRPGGAHARARVTVRSLREPGPRTH